MNARVDSPSVERHPMCLCGTISPIMDQKPGTQQYGFSETTYCLLNFMKPPVFCELKWDVCFYLSRYYVK